MSCLPNPSDHIIDPTNCKYPSKHPANFPNLALFRSRRDVFKNARDLKNVMNLQLELDVAIFSFCAALSLIINVCYPHLHKYNKIDIITV